MNHVTHHEIIRAQQAKLDGQGSKSAPSSGSEMLDAGDIPASSRRYVVTHTHKHPTLNIGDVVVMVKMPNGGFALIRESDMTAHQIKGESDQYVHLAPYSQPEVNSSHE